MEPSTSKKPRLETDFTLCIQCQEPGTGVLVSEPSEEACSKFLQFVHKRGQYGDANYAQISGRLHGYTASNVKDKKAKWHRKCYGSTCHSGHLERARHDTRRPAKKERVSIYSRGVEGLLLQPLVYQTLLKVRLFTSHLQDHLLSMQSYVSFAKETGRSQFMRCVHSVQGDNCKRLLMKATIKLGRCS